MAIAKTHDLHKRRFSRNIGVGLVLAAFIVIVFGMTVVKVTNGNFNEALQGASQVQNGD
ncbi:conserved hypothetical protein [Citreicella sp. SE45]|uniref:Cytochrome C oxidase assembly protein n=1 Tax=Salipiger thiooxidans TaxID=282683 RepID=A0A1G7BTE3_9RHOB|nr:MULTISPECIES: hypothetical protein [Salipiger]EEX15644.1 conserved hypothetical protein [Citreicella sp. SE45]NIY98792.1 hypothetical protein [Salipiger sp. HF18]NVK62478.1 hypothetical protein [Paracoccaceae bacterium]SDE30267.1 hypothetical protein SAMN04488105_102373 [Salipiger thiooxidans]